MLLNRTVWTFCLAADLSWLNCCCKIFVGTSEILCILYEGLQCNISPATSSCEDPGRRNPGKCFQKSSTEFSPGSGERLLCSAQGCTALLGQNRTCISIALTPHCTSFLQPGMVLSFLSTLENIFTFEGSPNLLYWRSTDWLSRECWLTAFK